MIEIFCPACLLPMRLVETKRHYQDSAPIIVDQCLNCGGIWFDDGELFAIRHGEAEKIEEIDYKILKEVSLISNKPLSCPRDKSELTILQDQFFPQDVKVEICKKCYGFWFNRGEFVDFQKKRKAMISNPKKIDDPEFDKMIRDYLELHSESKKYDLIGSIGRVLSSNAYQESNPIRPASDTDQKVRSVVNVLINLLRSITSGFYR
ncbi:MAG: hypothetical protein QG603_635 [Patescibacteria group bacterium]|nr:hypothetical protein [Patescibacteria group bacterium]MDQ5970858.1 hypothetical protein [Patescibacteria group bacterium]